MFHKQGFEHQFVTSFYPLRLLGNNMNQKYFILMPPWERRMSSLNTDVELPESLMPLKKYINIASFSFTNFIKNIFIR